MSVLSKVLPKYNGKLTKRWNFATICANTSPCACYMCYCIHLLVTVRHKHIQIYNTDQTSGIIEVTCFWNNLFRLSRLHLFDYKYSNIVNIISILNNCFLCEYVLNCNWFLYFQHHCSSLQCHMIFRNHNNMLICCSRENSDYYQCCQHCCTIFLWKLWHFQSKYFFFIFFY